MTDEERYKKYVQEHCNKCKNKDKYDCEIRIHNKINTIVTKCDNYEREDILQKRKKTPINWQSW